MPAKSKHGAEHVIKPDLTKTDSQLVTILNQAEAGFCLMMLNLEHIHAKEEADNVPINLVWARPTWVKTLYIKERVRAI